MQVDYLRLFGNNFPYEIRSTFLPRATESALFYCSNENDVRLADPVDEVMTTETCDKFD